MSFNIFSGTRRFFADAGRTKPEVRGPVGTKALEACVAAFAEMFFVYVRSPSDPKLRKPAKECARGLRAIQPAIFDGLLAAFRDYGNTSRSRRLMVHWNDNSADANGYTSARLRTFSDRDLTDYARAAASFLWTIHQKNIHARTALARLLAADGASLNLRRDSENGIAQVKTAGTASARIPGYFLCRDAENFLAVAERKGEYVTVNEHLMVKFVGYVTALCTKSFRTSTEQVFVEGVFYSPDKETEKYLKKEFRKKGIFKANLDLPNATWHVIRAYDEDNLSSRFQKIGLLRG